MKVLLALAVALGLFVIAVLAPKGASAPVLVIPFLQPAPAAVASAPAPTPGPAVSESPTPTATTPAAAPAATPRPAAAACGASCRISGRVTAANGNPIPGTSVVVYEAAEVAVVASGVTDANGSYSVTVAGGRTYKMLFIPIYVNYASEWWNNKSSPATADVLRVNGHVTVNVVLAAK